VLGVIICDILTAFLVVIAWSFVGWDCHCWNLRWFKLLKVVNADIVRGCH